MLPMSVFVNLACTLFTSGGAEQRFSVKKNCIKRVVLYKVKTNLKHFYNS